MTAVLERPGVPGTVDAGPRQRSGILARTRAHAVSNVVVWAVGAAVLVMGFITRGLNVSGYPRWFSDEGTYVSQAWAMVTRGEIAQYTYWYDHPFAGWGQIALWEVFFGGLSRNTDQTIMAGRELMVLMGAISVLLVYMLSLRLRYRLPFAFLAAVLFACSPLAVAFGRYALLDNIVVFWLLLAMVLALSPTRRLSAALACSLCVVAAVLSKETAVIPAVAVWYLLWQNYHGAANWSRIRLLFWLSAILATLSYPIYALIKNELFPGPGHVSLWDGQIKFQLFSRKGSGHIWHQESGAYHMLQDVWLGADWYLPLAGAAAVLPALCVRRLRAPALALLLQAAMLFKGGYLPYPYIIAMLPFMALVVAGMVDVLWPSLEAMSGPAKSRLTSAIGAATILVAAVIASDHVMPKWQEGLTHAFTAQDTAVHKQALAWVGQHVPTQSQVITEGELWLDIYNLGFGGDAARRGEVIWTYKVETDPEVKARLGGKENIHYLVLSSETLDSGDVGTYATILEAAKTAQVVATFGIAKERIVVMRTEWAPPLTS